MISVLLNSQANACSLDLPIEAYDNDDSLLIRNKICTMIETNLNQHEIQYEDFRKNNTIENIKKQFYETIS